MKQIYLFVFMTLLGLTARAQELTFYIGDTKIEPKSTIYFNDIKIVEASEGVDYTMAPKLSIASDADATVNIKAACTSGQKIQLCAGGLCEMGTTVEKKDISLKAATKQDLQFECIGYTLSDDEKIPVVVTDISARTTDGKGEVSFTIVMNDPKGGIETVADNETICDAFTITGVCKARGKSVAQLAEELTGGIYILRFANGMTRKMLINR